MTQATGPVERTSTAPTDESAGLESLRARLGDLKDEPGSLLEALYIAQDTLGYVTPAAIELVAEELGYPEAHVFGVVTFYTLFYTEPQPKHIVRICRDLSCHIAGAEKVATRARQEIGAHPGHASADGLLKLELVSCLGQCEKQPALMVNLDVHGPVTEEGVSDLIRSLREENL
jgi:NADH-quinone oxidoreductase subunit E